MTDLRPRFLSPGEEIHIWWIDLRAAPDDINILSPHERARAARFHQQRDRIRWTRAHAAVRHILSGYLGLSPQDVQFIPETGSDKTPVAPSPSAMGAGYPLGSGRGVRGIAKPKLLNDPRLRFNLAHAEDRAALAVAWEREVGIDLEPLEAVLDVRALLPIACSPAETVRIEALHPLERVEAFLTLWTVKEAYLKAIGLGMSREPRALEIELGVGGCIVVHDAYDPRASFGWGVRLLDAGPGWVAALAVEDAGIGTRAFAWPTPTDAPV